MNAVTVAREIGGAAATLVWVFLVCFTLLHAMPGNPLDRLDSPDIPQEQSERNRRALGLDRPVPQQLVRTLTSYLRGDLGVSFSRRKPVATVLGDALPQTLLLGTAAMFLAYGIGVPLALAILLLGPRARNAAQRLLLIVATVPGFWLGVMLILLFHGVAGWLPASHAFSPGGGDAFDRLAHLILPALTLGLPAACVVARYQYGVMARALAAPHVLAARATGSGGARLIAQQVLRPSAGPAVALFGLDLPILVSGAIVVEVVFAWPGIGSLTAAAVLESDYPLALASALLTSFFVVLGRQVSTVLGRALQPALASTAAEGRA